MIELQGPVAWIWLDHPEVHNAFDAALIHELSSAYLALGRADEIRAIVLAARGKSFCAGARVQWMREQGSASRGENAADAWRLAELFRSIAECPKPTLARVQGAALGGGVGLVAACDIAIGSTDAVFATSEVRLGLIPAAIGPYVVRAIGERQARRFFQTGERIDAASAVRVGLLHEAVASDQLDSRIHQVIDELLGGAPIAQREAKQLIASTSNRPITADLIEDTAQRIAARRAHPEAAEGLSAFLEKRHPAWMPKS